MDPRFDATQLPREPRQRGDYYTAADDCHLTSLWRAGMSVAEVAAHLNRSIHSIRYRVAHLGLHRDPRLRIEAGRKRRAEARKLRAAGATVKQIAARFGLTRQRVHQILKAPSP